MEERETPAITTALILAVLVLAAGVGVYYFTETAETPPPQAARPQEGPQFKEVVLGRLPEDWAVTDLDGKELTMRQLRGKVVFLNQWATWCGPCVHEMPSIQALYESLRGQDIAFVILSNEQPDTVKSFVKKRGWSLPVYVVAEGVPPVLQTRLIPVTFVINRRGEVIFRQEGSMDWNTDTVRAFLKKVS
jgi:thiol-disulfide isomerase/thioredoxin